MEETRRGVPGETGTPLVAGRLCWWRGGGSATLCPTLSSPAASPPKQDRGGIHAPAGPCIRRAKSSYFLAAAKCASLTSNSPKDSRIRHNTMHELHDPLRLLLPRPARQALRCECLPPARRSGAAAAGRRLPRRGLPRGGLPRSGLPRSGLPRGRLPCRRGPLSRCGGPSGGGRPSPCWHVLLLPAVPQRGFLYLLVLQCMGTRAPQHTRITSIRSCSRSSRNGSRCRCGP
jgi:hypothetical protein